MSAMLKAQGHEVVGIALPPLDLSLYKDAGLSDLFSHEHFIDIRDRVEFKRAIVNSGADIAFHMAAQPLVLKSYLEPRETFEINIMGTTNVLDISFQVDDIRAVVVVTTDKVYFNNNKKSYYNENDRLGGMDPYSNSKSCADCADNSYYLVTCFNAAAASK
jgi:CDP-glucose 4,6-dehydratase